MLGRRPFLIGGGSLVAAPLLAPLAAPAAAAPGAPSAASADAAGEAATARQDFVLRIQGWDTPSADARAGNEAWIHIDSSWRASWR